LSYDRKKNAAEWFYSNVYKDERITPRAWAPPERLPSMLRTARSLENKPGLHWQSRESVFLKQAKLLAAYEDDYPFSGNVVRYYPTYESLSNQELRGYFTWRTKLRRGETRKTSLSFVFLHIYELINQIGIRDPEEGYEKLLSLRNDYGSIDDSILPYLDRWMVHYVVYYGLAPQLLEDLPRVRFDRSICLLEHIDTHSVPEIMEATTTLSPKWLGRSKFYASHKDDMDTVIVRVLKRVVKHYEGCKRGFGEQFFGPIGTYEVRLFDTAVFCDPMDRRIYEYSVDDRCVYRCRNGHWTVTQHALPPRPNAKLGEILKAVDAALREATGYGHPIKSDLETKWLLKIIREEVAALQEERKAAEKKKLKLDFSQLDKIRRDAAVTQEKLTVEEDLEQEEIAEHPPEFLPLFPGEEPPQDDTAADITEPDTAIPADCPLTDVEYRLVRDLLYGADLGWVHTEGHILSVLLDSINDKLYDVFLDTVLEDGPSVVEDYIEELKEMVKP